MGTLYCYHSEYTHSEGNPLLDIAVSKFIVGKSSYESTSDSKSIISANILDRFTSFYKIPSNIIIWFVNPDERLLFPKNNDVFLFTKFITMGFHLPLSKIFKYTLFL